MKNNNKKRVYLLLSKPNRQYSKRKLFTQEIFLEKAYFGIS